MILGSLFSGIGGLERGLERGIGTARTAFQVEADPYCRHVLANHWPDALRFDDVRTVGRHNLPPVDLLCGGFPCTDLSAAGKQAGMGTRDAPTRSGLWFEMERIIDECRPSWVVVENVGHTWRSWVPFVRGALWGLGYASVPVRVRASYVGARHERVRVFIVAGDSGDSADIAHLDVKRWYQGASVQWDPRGREQVADAARGAGPEGIAGLVSPGWGLPPRPWMVRGVHGLPGWVDGARRSGWTPARIREARIHALGNSVVPACAEVVGRLIVAAEGAK